jgi:hypothetical protein
MPAAFGGQLYCRSPRQPSPMVEILLLLELLTHRVLLRLGLWRCCRCLSRGIPLGLGHRRPLCWLFRLLWHSNSFLPQCSFQGDPELILAIHRGRVIPVRWQFLPRDDVVQIRVTPKTRSPLLSRLCRFSVLPGNGTL